MPKAAALAFIFVTLALPARAACTVAELQQLKAKLVEIKDLARRQEVRLLLEKAEKDQRKQREKLCADALQRANALLR
jgi:hypothetical protein